ncbi:hypothetical protein ILUMI_21574 [Ignelater luminosus]|uniref:Rab-GAP TBC domain-containing protein n=1 Tax=Ignelater luminosus TaxID=2038154 RepID=A0A8K0G3K6_IGNLU|nr:hypothetical protein ILUMI_21574 [Ignelater luminosus]
MLTTNKSEKRLSSTVSLFKFSELWTTNKNQYCFVPSFSHSCISKSLSDMAARKVLENHKTFTSKAVADNMNSENPKFANSKNKKVKAFHKIPGRPQLLNNPWNGLFHNDESSENKLEKFERLLSGDLTSTELCQLSWSGIPMKVRATVWRLLSGYIPLQKEKRQYTLNKKRQDYLKMVKEYYHTDSNESNHSTYHQIHIDVPRMNPSIPLFQQNIVQEMFERILFIWAIRHPAAGYVQGINDLVTPFFIVFLEEAVCFNVPFELLTINVLTQEQRDKVEADTFWCAWKFLESIQDNYITAQPGIQQKVVQLKKLIERIDDTLHQHLVEHNVDYLQFSFRWLNNLLTRELPLRCIIRLWDTYLAENETFSLFQLYVCAAFLLHWREKLLLETDFQGLMLFLQNLPTHNWTNTHISLLVAEAYRLKVMFADSPNHLKCK